MDGQFAAVAQGAQASARHLDGTTLRVNENERIEVQLLVQQAPNVGFELEWFVIQAMVLGIIVPQNIATGRAALLRKARAVGAAAPLPVRMEDTILAVGLVALGSTK